MFTIPLEEAKPFKTHVDDGVGIKAQPVLQKGSVQATDILVVVEVSIQQLVFL